MKLFALTFLSLSLLKLEAQEHFILVGTYDSPRSEGIYVYHFNSSDGTAREAGHIKTSNPSFLTVSPDQRFVYAVNENADSTGKAGSITAFAFDKKNATLTEINKRSSLGNHPCYIDIDKTGKWIAVANYSSGNFCIYEILEDGSIGNVADSIQFTLTGKEAPGQKASHAHCTMFSPDNKYLLVTDLGLSKIISYEFDDKKGELKRNSPYIVHANPGFGPRHLDFHPSGDYVYVMNELSSFVEAYRWINGKLIGIETMTSMSKSYSGPAGSADIHVSPDGKFLYASNRANANDIAIFSIHKKNGTLTHLSNQPALGKTPRNFSIDPSGKYLLCENQNSDEIVVFNRNEKTGLLSDTGTRIQIGKPVCIKWISKN